MSYTARVIGFGLFLACVVFLASVEARSGYGQSEMVNVTYNATSAVYMNFSVPQLGTTNDVRVIIGLFDTVVPKTTENFRMLCSGKLGMGYKGCPIHRTVPGFIMQGGDYEKGDGTGGKSIYKDSNGNYSIFDDENFIIEHSDAGFVSMANSGPNTNGAQFFITAEPTAWLDDMHVVFGKVLEGQEYVDKITAVPTDDNHRPKKSITITDCGIWNLKEPVLVNSTKTTFDYHHLEF